MRNMIGRAWLALLVAGAALAMSACTQAPQQEPEPTAAAGGGIAFEAIQASADYMPAPGFESPQPAKGPHGDQVQVRLNDVANQALQTTGATTWPNGTIIVKDVYTGGTITQYAAMKKVGGEWWWAEYNPDGSAVQEPAIKAEPCNSCHESKGTDFVISVSLQ